MFQALRKHLTPSTLIAFVALVFALTGGAFAATGAGSGGSGKATASATHATTVATAAKSKAAPKGKPGPRGPAGPKGATGATGATGPAGPAGATGPAGPTGPVGATGATGATGSAGGTGNTGAQGKEGKEGPAGKEGTFGGQTLPAGKTLRGAWSGSGYGEAGYPNAGFGLVFSSASFPLEVEITDFAVTGGAHYIKEEEGEGQAHENKEIFEEKKWCTGTSLDPGAAPGNLCVFAESEINVTEARVEVTGGSPASAIGFTVHGLTAAKGRMGMAGTWAVTAGS